MKKETVVIMIFLFEIIILLGLITIVCTPELGVILLGLIAIACVPELGIIEALIFSGVFIVVFAASGAIHLLSYIKKSEI